MSEEEGITKEQIDEFMEKVRKGEESWGNCAHCGMPMFYGCCVVDGQVYHSDCAYIKFIGEDS